MHVARESLWGLSLGKKSTAGSFQVREGTWENEELSVRVLSTLLTKKFNYLLLITL